MDQAIKRVAEKLKQAERILLITGAGLSADSGLPTYRGLGGLYNGHTAEGLPIEEALSGSMLQRRKPQCWLLTQNIDGYHRAAGSPMERVIEIHGELAPLYCQSCGAVDTELAEHLERPLPPKCRQCAGVLRPPVVLFEEMLPEQAIDTLYTEVRKGFEVVISIGTSASFPYIVEPLLRTRQAGGFTVEINPQRTDLSARVDVHLQGRALDVLPELLSHI